MSLGKHDFQGQHSHARTHAVQRYYNLRCHTTDYSFYPLLIHCSLKKQGLMKGYISHSHQLVVLSKDKPFPWYAPYRNKGQAFLDARAEREKQEREKVPTLPAPDASTGAA